jgi:plasmid stabilization system protein ParE
MVRHVIVPAKSQKQLAKVVKYISLDSRQNAEKVKTEILASTRNLVANPGMHAEDKYKKILMEAFVLTNCITIG